MSSVASHVHAASSFASSLQLQTAGSTPDTDSDPFAAMLDAMVTGRDTVAGAGTAPSGKNQASPPPAGQSGDDSAPQTADNAPVAAASDKPQSDPGSEATSPAGNSATPSSSAPIFTAKTGSNLIQAAAAGGNAVKSAAAKADEIRGSDLSPASAAGGQSKTGAALSIADKLSRLLGTANTTNTAADTADTAQPPANTATSRDAAAGNTADTVAPGATDVAGIIAAVKAALAGPKIQQTTASDSSEKTPPSKSSQDSNDDSATNDAGTNAAIAISPQQPVIAPIAAPLTVVSPTGPQPTAGNTSADVTIGATGKAPAKLALVLADAKDGAARQAAANDTASAKPGPAAEKPALKGGPQSGTSNASTAPAQAANDQQQNPPADTTAPTLQAPDTFPPASSGQPAPHAEAFAAAATSDTPAGQTTPAGTKVDAAGLPNFGVAVAAASAPAATATASAAANTPNTVPVAGLAVAIAGRAQSGSSQFDIRLDPPELGRIEVRLGVDRDGRVTSHITVDRAETLQLLQNQQPQLQQALDQAGLKTADNGLQFTLRDQSFANQNNNGGNGGTQQNTPQLVIPDADLPPVQSAQIYNRLGLGSGVDIRV